MMKKTLLAILATAAALSASAATIELLKNGAGDTRDGWNWNDVAILVDWDGDWFMVDSDDMAAFNLWQIVTLADYEITDDVLLTPLTVKASVEARAGVDGCGNVCTVKVYQLDANENVLDTHTILDKSSENASFGKTVYALDITLNGNVRKLKYEIIVEDDSRLGFGPRFRNCSLSVNKLAITFVSQDEPVGTGSCFLGGTMPTAPTLSRNGYRFLGYFTDATGGVQVYDGSFGYVSGGSSGWTPTSDATLYARWVPVAITFKSEDATVGTVTYSEEGLATAPVPTRSGDYTFLGYFTEDGQQVYDGSGTLVQGSLSQLSSDVTLRAHWQRPAGSVARLVYRGQLTKLGKDEPPASDGGYTKTMHFRVYDDESAETPIWKADNQTVNVNKDGSFVATFGDDTLAELIATGSVTHVGVAIGSSAIELKPRRALRPVAAVNRALVAEGAGKDPRIGNLVTENALAANNVTISLLEVAGTVTAPGAGPVDVSPVVVGERETLTLLRGDGVNVFSKNRIDLGETANVLRGQKIGSRAAPSDGIALITSSKTGLRGLRIPGVIQYCREGEWVRAPASEPEGVKVTFFPFCGSAR